MVAHNNGKPAPQKACKKASKSPPQKHSHKKHVASANSTLSAGRHPDLRHIYNDEAVKEIAAECGVIPPELYGELKLFLIDAAEKYRDVPRVQSREERLIAMRDKFEHIETAGCEFLAVLSELTTDERWHLWAPEWDNPALPDFIYENVNITGYPSQYDTEVSFYAVLNAFQKRIESMKSRLVHVKNVGGRPTKDALAYWAVAARDFFEDKLKRKFNYYERYGQRKSAAFKFMSAAIRLIDNDVTDARIATAIKSAAPRSKNEGTAL